MSWNAQSTSFSIIKGSRAKGKQKKLLQQKESSGIQSKRRLQWMGVRYSFTAHSPPNTNLFLIFLMSSLGKNLVNSTTTEKIKFHLWPLFPKQPYVTKISVHFLNYQLYIAHYRRTAQNFPSLLKETRAEISLLIEFYKDILEIHWGMRKYHQFTGKIMDRKKPKSLQYDML